MQQLAKQIGADDQMLRFAVLNGLRPNIKIHVTRSQPTDWKSLVEAAKVGEMCHSLDAVSSHARAHARAVEQIVHTTFHIDDRSFSLSKTCAF